MSTPVIADNERARLSDLRSYKILDTDPEKSFDDLTLLASHICQTPIALITLIDEDRQWFKSRVGVSISQTPREVAFCARAIEQPDLDRKSTRLNSSHMSISYAVFCLKKKKNTIIVY